MASRSASDETLHHLATCVAQIVENRSQWADDIDYAPMRLHLVDQLAATQLAFLQFLAYPVRREEKAGISMDTLPIDENGRLRTGTVLNLTFPAYSNRPAALPAILGASRLEIYFL